MKIPLGMKFSAHIKTLTPVISLTCMKAVIMSLFMLIASGSGSYAQSTQELLAQANKAFLAGNEDAAKVLYLNAIAQGSADAHYWLASRYRMGYEEALHHYSEAAKSGHAEALTHALDMLLFRANSLTQTDPKKALDLYNEAKKANPKLNTGYLDEERKRVMAMCAEPKGFNAQEFMKKYGLKETGPQPYYIWELAEEASKGGRFGKADPELVFNLVMRGGFAPVELMSAVEDTYRNWKTGVVRKFDICKYVTSSYGQGYCADRVTDEKEEREGGKLAGISAKLGKRRNKLLDKAYDAATKFFEEKAENEEGYRCGTAHVAMVLSSKTTQSDQYLALVEKVMKKKFKPSPKDDLEGADQKLNGVYQDMMDRLKKDADSPCPCIPAQDEIKSVQRAWIVYRDASVKLFVAVNPAINEKTWRSWLTETRRKELESALKLIQELESCQDGE